VAHIRAKKRKGKSGVQTYYYLVEGQRIDGNLYSGKIPSPAHGCQLHKSSEGK